MNWRTIALVLLYALIGAVPLALILAAPVMR